jgi:hypothetical protein
MRPTIFFLGVLLLPFVGQDPPIRHVSQVVDSTVDEHGGLYPDAPYQASELGSSCASTAAENPLPTIVGPMTGKRPVWLADGSAGAWRGPEKPVKTLWVFSRELARNVRIQGQLLDGVGRTSFRRGLNEPITQALVITDPAAISVIPGGATQDIMKSYAFVPSYIYYPTRGCWELAVQFGGEETRIVLAIR